jgi:hypothetical protein
MYLLLFHIANPSSVPNQISCIPIGILGIMAKRSKLMSKNATKFILASSVMKITL